jgi:site-specific DNA-cytosine methylase
MQPIKFGSLFAGIGGFDLGFERAGMVWHQRYRVFGF